MSAKHGTTEAEKGARVCDGLVPSVAAAPAWRVSSEPAMIGACASSSSTRAARSRSTDEALLGIVILVAAVVIACAVLRLPGNDESASETNEEEELLGMIAGNWERIDRDP